MGDLPSLEIARAPRCSSDICKLLFSWNGNSILTNEHLRVSSSTQLLANTTPLGFYKFDSFIVFSFSHSLEGERASQAEARLSA